MMLARALIPLPPYPLLEAVRASDGPATEVLALDGQPIDSAPLASLQTRAALAGVVVGAVTLACVADVVISVLAGLVVESTARFGAMRITQRPR
jgi:hypothetical protein